ncbi:hypothetical protein BJ741DRAFT_615627 [Chytriomyces cf. hyalinus JEL632]|nr:hypothetical protein BJ741DRAFT_615627 [Chytriomyces cf. hyalinus JEL632]
MLWRIPLFRVSHCGRVARSVPPSIEVMLGCVAASMSAYGSQWSALEVGECWGRLGVFTRPPKLSAGHSLHVYK